MAPKDNSSLQSQPTDDDTSARIDVDEIRSRRTGAAGVLETVLRRFRILVHALLLLPMYCIGAVAMGVAAAPGIVFVVEMWGWLAMEPVWLRALATGSAAASGYFVFGFLLLFIMPLVNLVLGGRLRPWRGAYYSLESIRWYVHNGATYLLRYTFLEFVTPSPFNLAFFRLMGMRIGRGTIINTSYISDPSLIEIGEKTTIGGSATLLAHYGVGGYLVLSPVKIGSHVTIGLKASIMGGVEIGDRARVLPHSVVMPKTKIPPGEVWGGVPARRMD